MAQCCLVMLGSILIVGCDTQDLKEEATTVAGRWVGTVSTSLDTTVTCQNPFPHVYRVTASGPITLDLELAMAEDEVVGFVRSTHEIEAQVRRDGEPVEAVNFFLSPGESLEGVFDPPSLTLSSISEVSSVRYDLTLESDELRGDAEFVMGLRDIVTTCVIVFPARVGVVLSRQPE